MKKSRSVVHIGKGKRKRGHSFSAEKPSVPRERKGAHNNSIQSDMVKYMMNDILCGENKESCATSLNSIEEACRNVDEAMEQKAISDGQDAACLDFMHSMWTTIQYCMNAYMSHLRDKKARNESMEEGPLKAIQIVYSTAKPFVNRLRRIDTLLETLTFMIQVEDMMPKSLALSSSVLGKKRGSMSWSLSEAIELVSILEELIGNKNPCPEKDELGQDDSTCAYHMPVFQTYLRAAENASLHEMELVGNNSLSKAMAVMRHPGTLEKDSVLMKRYLLDFFLERAMRQPATGGNPTQGLSDCNQAIQLAEDALCITTDVEDCAEISSKLEMVKILNAKFLYRLERHEEALKMIHCVDLACIQDVEEQQDLAFMVCLIRARIYAGVKRFDDSFNELLVSARIIPGLQIAHRTEKMEEFAECLEKMLEMAEGSIGHAAEATATFLKLNHGSSSCILGLISHLDQMMTDKRHMLSEERFTPLFQMLADDFVRSALTKDEIGRESCYSAFQRAAAVAFGDGKVKESLEFLQACLHYGPPVRKPWTITLMAALYLHSKNYEMSFNCIQKAKMECSAIMSEPVGQLVHLLFAIEMDDDDMGVVVGRRIAQDSLQWTEVEWLALAELASYSQSEEAKNAAVTIQKQLWPENAKLVKEIVQVTDLCHSFSTSTITVGDFTNAIEQSLYEISDHVENFSRVSKDSCSTVQRSALFDLTVDLLLSLERARSHAGDCHDIVVEVKILTTSYLAIRQLIGLISQEEHSDRLCALLQEEIRILALLFDLYIKMHNGHIVVPSSKNSLKRARDIFLQINRRVRENDWMEKYATFISFMDAIISFSSNEAAKLGQWLLQENHGSPKDSIEVSKMQNFWLKMCSYPNAGSSVVRIVVKRFAAEISCTEESLLLISKHSIPMDGNPHALCLMPSEIDRGMLPPSCIHILESLEDYKEPRAKILSHMRLRHLLPWAFSYGNSEARPKQDEEQDCMDASRQRDEMSPNADKRLEKTSQDCDASVGGEGSGASDDKELPDDAGQLSNSEEEQSESSPLKNIWRLCMKRVFNY